MVSSNEHLKELLESIYRRYNRRRYIASDPLCFVYEYEHKADMEIVGFFASALAYGRVKQIQASLSDLFGRMGESPYDFVMNFEDCDSRAIAGFKHRFNTAGDICDLVRILQKALRDYGSLEKTFAAGYSVDDPDIVPGLTKFVDRLRSYAEKPEPLSRGLNYLLCSPENGSACKRLNLFLAWMVRKDAVCPGLWRGVKKSSLIIPVDVHMARLCKILGLYQRKTIDLKAAIEITEGFCRLKPEDPVKYDFALSRIGIVENCTGRKSDVCISCPLMIYCDSETRRHQWKK